MGHTPWSSFTNYFAEGPNGPNHLENSQFGPRQSIRKPCLRTLGRGPLKIAKAFPPHSGHLPFRNPAWSGASHHCCSLFAMTRGC